MRVFWFLLGALCFYNVQTLPEGMWRNRAVGGVVFCAILVVWNPGGKK